MATSTLLSPSTYDISLTLKTEPQGSMVTSQQRPNLRLDTSASHRTFGKNNTGLRIDNISNASPTTRNTTQNTYSLVASESSNSETFRTKARKPLFPRLQTAGLNPVAQPPEALQVASLLEAPHSSARSTAQTSRQSSPSRPYSLPVEIRSILLNGPISKRERPATTPLSADLPAEMSKDRSPIAKKVCFRDPVEEDIKNSKYLMRHSDLRSRSTSPAPPTSNPALDALSQIPPPRASEIAPKPGDSAGPDDDDEEPKSTPKTPIAGRNKHDRDWKWTLGPLPTIAVEGSALLRIDSHSSEEDLDDSLLESVAAAGGFQASQLQKDDEEDD